MKKEKLTATIAVLISSLFLYAAFAKLLEYTAFKNQLLAIDFLKPFAGVIAWMVPVVEIILAGLLIIRTSRLSGLVGAFFLMLLFTSYIFVLLHFGTYPLCSCGGIISTLTMREHFYFNAFVTILSAVGVYFVPHKKIAH